jgi:hypothetical protein
MKRYLAISRNAMLQAAGRMSAAAAQDRVQSPAA